MDHFDGVEWGRVLAAWGQQLALLLLNISIRAEKIGGEIFLGL